MNSERPARCVGQHSKVALVEGEEIGHAVAIGEHNDRSVSQSEIEIGVSQQDGVSLGHIAIREGFQLVRALGHLREERLLDPG